MGALGVRNSKRFLLIGLALLLCILLYGNTEGATWKLFEEGEVSSYYYFPGTMKVRSSGLVSVWVRSIPQAEKEFQKIMDEREEMGLPLKKDVKNYGYSHFFIKFNCKENKMKIVQEKIFNKDGFLLTSYFVPPYWKILDKNSFPNLLPDMVCPKKYAKK